ncbi:hypothetical protein ODZ83_08675 [Acaricomes phytoseiuli]|uniref:hypothetical protein n=1 Tax=Acaricomes phytoseiuli TaxID=291968 RepID=UPI002223E628|nr:hypothetical protein [Acaricomes phytoseiuli]MCW1250248.1 hypothetical protein [Acaricomes phytoseiuli]
MYTGDVKFTGFSSPFAEDALRSALRSGTPLPEESVNGRGLSDLLTKYRVTADPRRAPFTPIEYMRRHRDPAYLGAGPVGHGFTEEAIAAGRGYYTFPTFPTAATGTAARVTGIALDSTNRAGYTAGSLGQE